ncbi:MAG: methionine aminotransferase [Bacteroidota bacterium]
MANDHKAINLSQGFPDFPVSKELIERVNHYMTQGHNQYAPMAGVASLRDQISRLISNQYGFDTNSETEITITSGATEALFSTIAALIKQGDEVIVFDPAYDSYDPAIRLAGGKAIHLPLRTPKFNIDWDLLSQKVNKRTRMIVVNTPHNPSGTILSDKDMSQLEVFAEDHDLLVLSDEVYEHIVFDLQKHQSALKYPKLRNRCIAVFSFGKTFHATGWKVGYLVAPQYLTDEIRKMHQYITFSVSTPVQYAIADYLKNSENYTNLGSMYQQKRDFFLDKLKDSRFEAIASEGTYFQLLSYQGIAGHSDIEMAKRLTVENGVASIPISVFYENKQDHKLLRFCFAKSEETLSSAAEILCKI